MSAEIYRIVKMANGDYVVQGEELDQFYVWRWTEMWRGLLSECQAFIDIRHEMIVEKNAEQSRHRVTELVATYVYRRAAD